jgi:hypothetical protein
MDEDRTFTRKPVPGHGGSVEPANRAEVAKAKFQTPMDKPGERYELRDPFAEVTYRANNMRDMVAKAEQLGSNRFVAVAADGKRTTVQKVDGEWPREGPRDMPRVGPRDNAKVIAMPNTTRAPAQPAQADHKALAKIDAQADRAALVARMEAALNDRYVVKRALVTVGDMPIGRSEYRFRGDTSRVAFTESTFRLATDTNSPSVARSMVDVAETRNWKALRVSGHEEFRRQVWFEASLRGVKTIGYEPLPSDQAWLRSEREGRMVNRIDLARHAGSSAPAAPPAPTEKASARGGGGRKTVLAAIEAVLVAKNVPEKQRAAVMAAAADQLAQRIRDGQAPRVKVYDKAAPSQRPSIVPTPDIQRSRDRAAPAPAR